MSTPGSEHEVLIIADTASVASPLAALVLERPRHPRCHFTLLITAVAHGLYRVVDPGSMFVRLRAAGRPDDRARPRLRTFTRYSTSSTAAALVRWPSGSPRPSTKTAQSADRETRISTGKRW